MVFVLSIPLLREFPVAAATKIYKIRSEQLSSIPEGARNEMNPDTKIVAPINKKDKYETLFRESGLDSLVVVSYEDLSD